jgi:hypothetical protein
VEEEIINKGYLEQLGLFELMALPFYLLVIFFIAYYYQRKKIGQNPSYTFFARGVMAKLLGATVFCFVYVYYYKGGDTIAYFEASRSYVKLLELRPSAFSGVYFGANTQSNFTQFDMYTGLPFGNMYFEARSAFVVRLLVPVLIMGLNSYLLSSIVLSFLSFFGIWRMYQLFYRYYPSMYKVMAYGFLFLPTVVFWGSGMLKDTITLSGFCIFVSSFEKCFISKQQRMKNLIFFLIAGYVVLIIKPYIIMASVPGIIAWLFHNKVRKIRSQGLKTLAIPFIYLLSIGVGIAILSVLGSKLDKFSLDKILFSAKEAQMDLKNENYQGHAFDIGNYDATVLGVISKVPIATLSGLCRPFIWEARNFVMILSALENLVLMYLLIYPFIRPGPRKTFKFLFNNPLLLFVFSYSILFAFSIGISTSNFGALIRFKIAYASFLAVLLLILYNYKKLKPSSN